MARDKAPENAVPKQAEQPREVTPHDVGMACDKAPEIAAPEQAGQRSEVTPHCDYAILNDLSGELAEISSLPPVAQWIAIHGQKEFETKLCSIVRAYRVRTSGDLTQKELAVDAPVEYSELIRECSNVAFDAAENLRTLIGLWSRLKEKHVHDILEVASPGAKKAFRSRDAVKSLLTRTRVVAEALSVAIPFATGEKPTPPGRGRRGKEYLLPTLELAALWHEISNGSELTTPRSPGKGPKPRLASQQSTVFVTLGLKMINPSISEAQIRTAIKDVRELRKDKAVDFKTLSDKVFADRFNKW
jgi:hypothetical protein